MERFLDFAQKIQINQYLAVSATTLLVYDYFQMIELEVSHIWTAKWDSGKFIYLFVRYLAFVEVPLFIYYLSVKNISLQACHTIISFVYLAGVFIVVVAGVILLLRTFALLGHNRWAVLSLALLYAGTSTGALVVTSIVVPSLRFGISPVPTIRSCFPVAVKPIGFVSFTLILAFDFVMMIIALIVWFRKFRHAQSRLVVGLYSDGLTTFIYVTGSSLLNIIMQLAGPPELLESFIILQIAMHSILPCRVLLNLRKDVYEDCYEAEYELGIVSDLRFQRSAGRGAVSRSHMQHDTYTSVDSWNS